VELTLKSEYWDNTKAKSAFKAFILDIHRLDFTQWDEAGFWDDAYTPFSYFKGDDIISSVCIYLLDAIIDGRSTHLVQISGVGTLPEFQRKGLSRQLTNIGLDWAINKHEGVFLFSDMDAMPYYQRCGFTALDEYLETTEVKTSATRPGLIKLDPRNPRDLNKIYQCIQNRVPISEKFSIINAKLDMFHIIYTLKNCLYEIPDLGCLIAYERDNGNLSIFDIVSDRIPSLDEIYPYIAQSEDTQIEFYFHTDKLEIDKVQTTLLAGNNLFIKGHFPIINPVFPFTSRA